MKIIQIPDISIPAREASPPVPPVAVQTPDFSRVEVLENIAKSILQKIQSLEERMKAFESSPTPAPTDPAGEDKFSIRPSPVTFDADAVKKGLLTKMWKYLNDAE